MSSFGTWWDYPTTRRAERSSMEVEWIVFGTYLVSCPLDAAVDNPDASLGAKIRGAKGERYRWKLRDKGQCATGQGGGQGGELNEHRQGVYRRS
jgi:hypothetical protein